MADRRFKSRSRSASIKRHRKYSRSRSTESRTPSPQLKRGRPYHDDRGFNSNRRQYREKRGRPNRWEDDPSEDGFRVHVGDIVKRTTQEEIEDAFRKYGYIKDIFVANTFPQFAIVSYEDKLDAEDAIRELDGNFLNGSKISVSIARPRKRQRDERKVHGSFSCYKCGRSGHIARDCEDRDDYPSRNEGYSRGRDRDRDSWKDRRQENKSYGNGDRGGGGGTRQMSCYRCGKTGHISRECDSSNEVDSKRRQRSRSYSPRRRKSRSASFSPTVDKKNKSLMDSSSPNGRGYRDEFDDYGRDRRDRRDKRDVRDGRDARPARDARDARERRDSRDSRDGRDSRDFRDDRDDHDDCDDRVDRDDREGRSDRDDRNVREDREIRDDRDDRDDREDRDDRDDREDREDREDRDSRDDRDEREISMENDQY